MSRKGAVLLLASGLGVLALAGIGLTLGSRPAPRPPPPRPGPSASASAEQESYEIAEQVLDGKLANGWEDWGWGRRDTAAPRGIGVDFSNFGGIILHHDRFTGRFGALVLRYRAPPGFDGFLAIGLLSAQPGVDETLPSISVESQHVKPLADGWNEVRLPWALLNPASQPFDRILIRARRSVSSDWVTLDHIAFTKPPASGAVAAAPPRPATVAVRCDKPATPINPLIYGIAAGEWSSGETIHRVGGNAMSRLNWELGAWNTASDWYFQNVKPEGEGLDKWLGEALERKVKMALTVPMIGWVAKDGSSVGFPVSKFGKQQSHDPKNPNAGNGLAPDGKPLRPGPPSETSIPAPPELIKRWITALREKDHARGARSVDVYMLDNEPGLWNTTHRDVHPDPLTYDELLDRTIRYGTAVREADPEAIIAGPAEWGWSGYFYSAKDMAVGTWLRPDRRAHGDVPLLPWYLQRLAAHERKTGTRILDWVDVHFYPQAKGVYIEASTEPQAAALRLRSTRTLWDPNYLDESWINERVQLIPRLRHWIANNYPGRGIALGEWSFGAEDHISGGLAIAEALGRFGQQGLTAAFYWRSLAVGSPGYNAFRAFRNYDGQGARFLDLSVPTDEAPGVSLFASRDEARSRLVLVLLNLDADFTADTRIDVSRCEKVVLSRVFTYAGAAKDLSAAPATTDSALAARGIVKQVLPPYSLAVVELALPRPGAP